MPELIFHPHRARLVERLADSLSASIPVFDRAGRANLGHSLETAVFVELERRRNEVTYVRTPSGREVDFLALAPDGSRELIQVCADPTEPKTGEREIRAL